MDKSLAIMLVDDDKIDLYVHAEVLKLLPFVGAVMQYTYAGDALNYLEQQTIDKWPDVILLDIRMPAMDGFEFLRRYQKLPAAMRNKCRVILLSSTLDADDLEKAHNNSELAGFIEKPLGVQRLQKMLGL